MPGHSRFSGVAVKFKCLSKRNFHKIKLVSRACLCTACRAASQSTILHPFNRISLPICSLDIASAESFLQCHVAGDQIVPGELCLPQCP